jgi:L-lactate dehydrogenase complex protein LldG
VTASPHSPDQHRVLDLVRNALGREVTLTPAPLEPFIEVEDKADAGELISRFALEAEAVRAHVHRLSDETQVIEKIIEACANQSGEIAVSGAEFFEATDLPAALASQGLTPFVGEGSNHDDLVARLANCGAGITCADCAIAETGTLVVSSDEQNALLVSLLPPLHIAVIRATQIVASLDQAITKLNQEHVGRVDPARSVSFITGPSRTSDVELVLTIGVHGPKELHIIILEM